MILALLMRWALDDVLGDRLPWFTVFLALLPLVLVVRPMPYLAAAVVGCLGTVFFFISPRLTLAGLGGIDAALFLVTVTIAAATAWLSQRFRRRSRAADAMLRAFVDDSPTCKWITNGENRIAYVNRAMAEALGRSVEEILGRRHADILPPRLAQTAVEHIEEVRRTGEPCMSFEEIEPLGNSRARRVLEWRRFLLRLDAEEHVLVAGMANDVTAKVRLEAELRASEERYREIARNLELLNHELAHRVKNTLATVQGIATQTRRHAQSPDEFDEKFRDRLAMLARAHALLARSRWESVELGEIVHSMLSPYPQLSKGGIVVDGEAVVLPARKALALSMILHELSTNAVKYGALSKPEGKVVISWQSNDGRVTFTWREKDGPPVAPPSGKGLGSNLIGRITSFELEGTGGPEYRPDGLVCELNFPLDSARARAAAEPPAAEPSPRGAE
jgi:PAS domain S-box-containing protein